MVLFLSKTSELLTDIYCADNRVVYREMRTDTNLVHVTVLL